MATTKSKKALCHLVCGASGQISSEVLKAELERNVSELRDGILCYPIPTAESLAAFTSKKNVASKLTNFILDLSKFIHVEELTSKGILQTYLSGDFRGTKDSLKKLVNDERCQKPLLNDIWQFHQAEKLYNLRIVKEILTILTSKTSEKHYNTYKDVFSLLDENNQLKTSIIKQIKSLIESVPPTKDKFYTSETIQAWAHFNLRQQCELLQILLLYFHQVSNDVQGEDILKLLKLFSSHRFGTTRMAESLDKSLMESIGYLESFLIVYLLDLPSLANTNGEDIAQNSIWRSSSTIQELDRSIGSSLGNLDPHGPPMLAWMLSHFLVDNQVGKYKTLGERAMQQLHVIEYLSSGLQSDALNANQVLSAISYGVAFGLVSILVTAFDPARMAIEDKLFQLLLVMVNKEVISSMLWKEGLDSNQGLSNYVDQILSEFPANYHSSVKLLHALASSSQDSATKAFEYLNEKEIFAEPADEINNANHIEMKEDNSFITSNQRHKNGLIIPSGVCGNLNRTYYIWRMEYSGFPILFHEVESLLNQLVHGAKNISNDTLRNSIVTFELLETFLKFIPEKMNSGDKLPWVQKSCLKIINKFVHVPNPPIQLLAVCLRCLSRIADDEILKSLTDSDLFPQITAYGDSHPGLIGSLLAQQECVLGTYPLTSAFLDLLMKKYHPSILFVVTEILPNYQNWRFVEICEQQTFGQKVLEVCFKYHDHIWENLMKPSPNQTLIKIASIGDRMIQSCFESQTTSETGIGVELAKLIILSLNLLNELLMANKDDPNAGQLGKVISSSDQPHFLLTVAHYIYHLQTPGLALSSIKFLSSVASLFPMSLLACLGNDAEALRDILIHRLESQTETQKLKVAILKFFTASAKTQPGLIQLLLSQASDDGCLKSVMTLLKSLKESQGRLKEPLQVQLMEFLYGLWSQNYIVAMNHLKKQEEFWTLLTWPLFEQQHQLGTRVNSFTLRIISAEIFTSKILEKGLLNTLEKLFDEKNETIQNWCDLMVNSASNSSVLDESVASADQDSDLGIFLLSSWKTLLIVLSKEQPIVISPVVCHKIIDSLVEAIRGQLAAMDAINTRMTISLAETCLILMQRWQTKCSGDSMVDFVHKIGKMLDEFATVSESLHPRARIALLGVISSALKLSNFKIDNETNSFMKWLPSACILVEKSLQQQNYSNNDQREAVLTLGLLRSLLQRLSNVQEWYGVIHRRSLLHVILSHTHHSLRSIVNPEVIQASLSLCLAFSKTHQGCHGLLSLSMGQLIWLPLSSFNRKLDKDWIQVFNLALQLALSLLRVGQQHALEQTLTVVALLQDQLTVFLSGPKNGNLEKDKMDLTCSTATLVASLMKYYRQWQLQHAQSLNQFYTSMCSLLHTSACLLIRPSVLTMMINQKLSSNAKQTEADYAKEEMSRVRRLSSTEQEDAWSHCPDTVYIQNKLLDTISSCLRMLIALSPGLVSLMTDDIVDHQAYEQLLHIGFSTPAFEQDESQGLSYGTIISISNCSIRAMTHSDRSPSPARSATSGSSTGCSNSERSGGGGSNSTTLQMDRKRLLMVLEQGLTLMLSQAMFCLQDSNLSPRDKQLLRRELGAELGSVNETMRRYVQRGSKTPQTVLNVHDGSKLAKSDEQFMKFVSTIVQKIFK